MLLHGFTGTGATWEKIVVEWMPDFQTLTIDLPGHGKTRPGQAKSMENFCRDLAALLDELYLEKVHLIGYSMGGRTALSFSMYYPERIKSLTLESASPGIDDEKMRKKRHQQDVKLAEWIESDGIKAFVDYWEKLPLFESQRHLPESIREEIRHERLSHSPGGLSESLRFMGAGAQSPWQKELPCIPSPVLLLSGEYDKKFIEINQMMERLIPSAEHTTVQHAGHAIHVERPSIFGKIVTGFLKSV
ncbi:putative 2-succinyl-6-hydroxy-2,4-cyclohexadiene-1-carboxylate synthase [Lentibacillus kapialis]|uniref:Putative 2-succinyl-6-hydroxy-2,4-cyclohexadiene-1-carboxylate synthase n=1 Tax=Lentibacillus kapialis TaxID=340214 RepID=A0A917PYJ0_9BACI|nr:putative 2-succinyl-6-hydroxy-2,4-cyclohexadiene-1-carboxylate synthase [Lentibacillus kapialis]